MKSATFSSAGGSQSSLGSRVSFQWSQIRRASPTCRLARTLESRLAESTADGSSLLRLPQLLRRPRAVHTPGGISTLRNPPRDAGGLPSPRRFRGDEQEPDIET